MRGDIAHRNRIDEANKSKLFWDGFQWIEKVNSMNTVNQTVLKQTKKMRTLIMANLPLHLGLNEKEISEIVTRFLFENYLNDQGNYNPVKEVTIDKSKNTATIELSSIEEANKLAKVDSVKVLGHSCKISKLESQFGQTTTLASAVDAAQKTAQAQAAVYAALNMLQNKDNGVNFNLSKPNILGNPTKIIKISNIVDPEEVLTFDDKGYKEVLEDMVDVFKGFGTIKSSFIVKQEKTVSGAEAGTVFIEYASVSEGEKAMASMTDKRYIGREIRIIYVPEDQFQKNFASLKTV